MSGPPRPRCRLHGKNDHDLCRGLSRKNFGEEFHPVYFGPRSDAPDRPSQRVTGRLSGPAGGEAAREAPQKDLAREPQ